jgi:hypothetical protein
VPLLALTYLRSNCFAHYVLRNMAAMLRCKGMALFTLLWAILSGPTAVCQAFSPSAGIEVVTFRRVHSFSSLAAHTQTSESSSSNIINDVLHSGSTRRNMIISSVAFITGASQVATKVNADVSDGNALPEGAQQFARTIKLKTDLKV